MKVVFMATGDIALPTLQWLLDSPEHTVAALVTQPDRPVGRKQVLTAPRVKDLAREHDIPVLQPAKIGTIDAEIAAFQADVHIVMAYGQILRQPTIDLAPIINLHASLLPSHRGASCIQAAIANGDAETGITVMHVMRALDAGDIISMVRTPIGEQETGGELHDRLAEIAPEALELALQALASGETPTPQDEAAMTYAPKLTREDGALEWVNEAFVLNRLIRAYHPWPGAYAEFHGQRVKIFPPTEVSDAHLDPGAVELIEGQLHVGTGDGSLILSTVQPAGKRAMPATDAHRGNPLDFR